MKWMNSNLGDSIISTVLALGCIDLQIVCLFVYSNNFWLVFSFHITFPCASNNRNNSKEGFLSPYSVIFKSEARKTMLGALLDNNFHIIFLIIFSTKEILAKLKTLNICLLISSAVFS